MQTLERTCRTAAYPQVIKLGAGSESFKGKVRAERLSLQEVR